MKKRGEIGFVGESGITTTKIIPPGNYTLNTIGKKLQEIFADEGIEVKFYDEKGLIVIKNLQNRKIIFDRDLTFLLGLNGNEEDSRTRLKTQTVINRLASLKTTLSTVISWIKMKIYSMEILPRSLPVLTSMENLSKEWNIHQNKLR